MKFTQRLTKPTITNKYYLHYNKGGYNTCIVLDNTTGNVLPNCVGYAHGRFLEIQGVKKVDWTIPNCNAEDFIETAKKNGLKVGNEPKLGAIIVWSVGALHNGADGAGHVAVVEEVGNDYIVTSESGYKSKAYFWTTKRTNANGNWGANAPYKFLGFIYQPKDIAEPVKEETKTETPKVETPKVETSKVETPKDIYYPKVNYNGYSIVDALKSIGAPSDYETRAKIAKLNGINGYLGLGAQNLQMLNMLREGTLKRL